MEISVAVQHHPSRAELLPPLLDRLAGLAVEVVSDPDPEAPPATWRTYRAALGGPDVGTHRLVVQDDALPCASFAAVLERVVAARPDRIVVLCVCGEPAEAARDVLRAYDRREPFAELGAARWLPTVAVVWPAPLIGPVLDYVAAAPWPADFLADDEILYRATLALGLVPVATVPSLVDHPDVVPSVLGRRVAAAGANLGRVAALPVPAGADPLELSWDDPPPPTDRGGLLVPYSVR